jgi:hypothetical protein
MKGKKMLSQKFFVRHPPFQNKQLYTCIPGYLCAKVSKNLLIISALKNTGKDFLGEKEIFRHESFSAALMAISTGDFCEHTNNIERYISLALKC